MVESHLNCLIRSTLMVGEVESGLSKRRGQEERESITSRNDQNKRYVPPPRVDPTILMRKARFLPLKNIFGLLKDFIFRVRLA